MHELATQLGHLGEPHFFRPYHDTRFHMRPPIKEQLGVAIGHGGSGGTSDELIRSELGGARPLVAWHGRHVGAALT